MQVESTSKPILTVDEVEHIQRKKLPIIIGRVFQLTYPAYCDKLVQEEKVYRFPAALLNISVEDTTLA